MAFTVFGIVLVNPFSLTHFVYYLCLWQGFIFLFHRESSKDFIFAFLVNSVFIAAYYLVQTYVYPESYGTTSPLGSWTDDSYFYALVADVIPKGLEVREGYEYSVHPFPSFIRSLTMLSIEHPMDVIFFQSGVAAMIATFSKRFMYKMSADARLSRTIYVLTLVCPMLMMHGGVVLLRDTLVAALLVYSLYCFSSRRFILALGAVGLSIMVRPGTAFILFFAYVIIYSEEIKVFARRHVLLLFIGSILALLSALRLMQVFPDYLPDLFVELTSGGGMSLLGRDPYEDLTASGGNSLFLAIQETPYLIKLLFGGIYFFMYPFFSLNYTLLAPFFDLRTIAMTLIGPIYSFWLNTWFISGALTTRRVPKKHSKILIAVVIIYMILGTYSLQTRHKIIVQPLYYFIVAVGFVKATPNARRVGCLCSSTLLVSQVALSFR